MASSIWRNCWPAHGPITCLEERAAAPEERWAEVMVVVGVGVAESLASFPALAPCRCCCCLACCLPVWLLLPVPPVVGFRWAGDALEAETSRSLLLMRPMAPLVVKLRCCCCCCESTGDFCLSCRSLEFCFNDNDLGPEDFALVCLLLALVDCCCRPTCWPPACNLSELGRTIRRGCLLMLAVSISPPEVGVLMSEASGSTRSSSVMSSGSTVAMPLLATINVFTVVLLAVVLLVAEVAGMLIVALVVEAAEASVVD